MSQNPRTLFIVSDRHLREQIKKDLLSECRGANVKLYEPDGKAHYGDLGAHEEQRFRVALKKASHIVVAVARADGEDMATVRKMFGWDRPRCLLVKSYDPAVYRQFGLLHKKHPRFKVVVAVGGPNGVQEFFSRADGLSIPVFTPFDL